MDEVVSVNWNNYSASFLENLKSFQNKECLCDSTIVCQEKFYPVHRLVLSLCSVYFKNIFERTPCKHPFIIINDIDATQLEALLNFIYQGEVHLSHKDLNDFMKAAEALKINGLLQNRHTVNSISNANYYNLSNNNLNCTYKQKNPIVEVEQLNSSKNCNLDEKLCPVSINVTARSAPMNLNIPKGVKRKHKSKIKEWYWPNIKPTKSNSVSQTKTVINNIKKVKRPIIPLRKSSRESVSKVSYFIPDEEIEEPNTEIPISRENGTSQITLLSYSSGNGEEFDNSQIISDKKNPIVEVEQLNSSKKCNLDEKLCPVSINVAARSMPMNLNIPKYVKRKHKSKVNKWYRPKVKPTKSNFVSQTKTVRNNVKKVKIPITPLRKPSRESVSKVSYFIPDEEIEEPVSEISIIRENGTSQITIPSYSGGNGEEFDNSQIISDQNVENIIKVEYLLDEISGYPPHPDFGDETTEDINSSLKLFAAASSQANEKDINYQHGESNNLDTSMVPDTNKQSLATSVPSTLKKVCKHKQKSPSKCSVFSSGTGRPAYICPFCGICFLTKSRYHYHPRKHTGE